MTALIQPSACPECQEPFQLNYAQQRDAVMPLGARFVLGLGIAATVVLIPLFLSLVAQLVIGLTAGMDLRRKERGLIFFLAYALSVPVALLPAWLGARFAFSRPRKLAVTCPTCRWRGICRITEPELKATAEPSNTVVHYESKIEGIPILEDPTRKRLERLQERRRKEAKRAEAEAEPNPDFDFGNEPPSL